MLTCVDIQSLNFYNEVMNDEYLSILEFAHLVKVHPNTIRNSIKCGKISAFRVGPGKRSKLRIAKSEIQRLALLDLREVMKKIRDL